MDKKFLNDDIYSGFVDPSMETLFYDLGTDDTFNTNFISSASGISNVYSRGNTASGFLKSGERQLARPSTAIRAVGYTSEAGKMFDPILQQKTNKNTIVLEKKNQEPQEKYRNLEKKIHNLLEESILVSTGSNANFALGLSKAKEASSLDRTLLRLRDQNGGTAYHNFDLMYSVFFNLANLYTKNDMYVEAINTYTIMTKNKMFPNINRLKVNMGNIYFRMGIYPKAIKMYRMALDQVPNNQKELRLQITHNIGILFIKMGQYSDAAASFEFIMSEKADVKSGMHLILCYYAMGDIEKIKKSFRALVEIQLDYEDDIKMQTDLEENQNNQYVFEAIKNDELSLYSNNKKKTAEKSIMMIADLISAIIEDNYNDGYNWCIEVIKSSSFTTLANELELNKALVYLKQNDVAQAIDTLRFYEKKDPLIAVNAVTNLIFIYLYLGDIQNATKYAEICRKIDSYNPAAFINSGVCEIIKGDLEMAKQYFEDALDIDVTSFEASYNLGIVYKKLGDWDQSIHYFNKIKQNLSHAKHPHIFYQIGQLNENHGDNSLSLDNYLQLLGISNEMDPGIYQKIAEIYENFNDRQESNQYLNESFRVNPSDIGIASSIGSYFIQLQASERAIYYYERAVLANPNEPNLMLRVASCFRNTLNPRKYLSLFENIYKRFPESISCLRALIHVTQSHGMMELNEKYTTEYQRLEKILHTRSRNSNSNRNSAKSRDSNSSAKGLSGNDLSSLKSSSGSGQMNDGYNIKNYADPLGPPAERPRTGQVSKSLSHGDSDDELDAEELLPL